MTKGRNLLLAVVLLLGPAPLIATDLNCSGNVEEFRYSWRVKGGLRWVAGLMFPTTGVGRLKTTYPAGGGSLSVSSELLITPAKGPSGGFFAYQSEMDPSGQKTLVTYSGYAWGEKSRKERTIFDYVKRLARIHRETPEKVEDRIKKMPDDQLQDVLTAIHYLRQNAGRINAPLATSIYSEGKEYPVVFRPVGRRSFVIENQELQAVGFEIVDAPGGKKWPGGVKVWISEDSRRLPCRIEINQSVAALQLDLKSVSCSD